MPEIEGMDVVSAQKHWTVAQLLDVGSQTKRRSRNECSGVKNLL